MAFVRSTLGLLALAIAIAGPLPLWMHHAISHSAVTPHAAAAGDDANSACCHHQHCHLPHRSTTEVAIQASGEDCFVCYQLAQPSSLSLLTLETAQNALPPEPIRVYDSAFVPAEWNPLWSRGPPTV